MNRAYGKNEKWLQIQSRNVYRHFLEVIFETLNHVRTHTNTLTTKRFSLVWFIRTSSSSQHWDSNFWKAASFFQPIQRISTCKKPSLLYLNPSHTEFHSCAKSLRGIHFHRIKTFRLNSKKWCAAAAAVCFARLNKTANKM